MPATISLDKALEQKLYLHVCVFLLTDSVSKSNKIHAKREQCETKSWPSAMMCTTETQYFRRQSDT